MIAAVYHRFKESVTLEKVEDPSPAPAGVVIAVKATGICRSDWFGWQGHDKDIVLPHVPGHELAGEIVAVGKQVNRWKAGDRVTVPFVGGCGHCEWCKSGNQQVCDHQFQPGFTAWGSFAGLVAIDYADENLVRIPDHLSYIDAASLGCRMVTAFRGLVDVAKIQPGEWVAVYGCGGVGLSAIMIAKASGARPIAIDIDADKLHFAQALGAVHGINAREEDPVGTIRELTKGGAQVSVDALGSVVTAVQSICSLRKLGRHVQIGLLEGKDVKVAIPMDLVIANEWQVMGSHGMQSYRYPAVFQMMETGLLQPSALVTDVVDLRSGVDILERMDTHPPRGIAVIKF